MASIQTITDTTGETDSRRARAAPRSHTIDVKITQTLRVKHDGERQIYTDSSSHSREHVVALCSPPLRSIESWLVSRTVRVNVTLAPAGGILCGPTTFVALRNALRSLLKLSSAHRLRACCADFTRVCVLGASISYFSCVANDPTPQRACALSCLCPQTHAGRGTHPGPTCRRILYDASRPG